MKPSLNAVEIAVEQAIAVLRARPSALITDIDGTISRIVARPEDATVAPGIRRSLERLVGQVSLVAVITARQESVARSMVGVPSLTYVGNYAVEAIGLDSPPSIDVAALIGAVRPLIAETPCVMLEEKGIGFSLHYRNCVEEGMRERLLAAVQPIALENGAKVVEGKQVIEIVPALLPDKGTALARQLEAAGIDGAIFMGDDLSDAAAFRELNRRRIANGRPSLAIGIVDDETPDAVREMANVELSGVDEVEQFLERLSLALAGAQS